MTNHNLVLFFQSLTLLTAVLFSGGYNPADGDPNMPTELARVPGSLTNQNTGSRAARESADKRLESGDYFIKKCLCS